MSLRFEKNTLLRGTDSNVKSLTSEEILELSGVKWDSQRVSTQGEGLGRKEGRLTDYLQSSGIRIAVDFTIRNSGN